MRACVWRRMMVGWALVLYIANYMVCVCVCVAAYDGRPGPLIVLCFDTPFLPFPTRPPLNAHRPPPTARLVCVSE